jgi:two-component system chemotaxis response regulator CheB
MVIRALIVDDSALIRKVLSDILNQDPKISVIGTAVNGKDGLEK